MTNTSPANRGLYFEEFEVGQKIMTVGRTVAESDIFTFAGFSGDFNQIHTDAEFSKDTPFGQRVAHGLLGLSIASGLAMRTGILEGTVIAFREIKNWKSPRSSSATQFMLKWKLPKPKPCRASAAARSSLHWMSRSKAVKPS